MRVHYLQHVSFEDLGSMRDYFLNCGHQLNATHLYLEEPLPALDTFDWLVVMGGPMGVGDSRDFPWLDEERKFIQAAIDAEKIVLGVCLGAQLIAAALGAAVYANATREIGWFPLKGSADIANEPLAALLDDTLAFHWHGDTFDLPTGATLLASSDACHNQAFALYGRVFALQFHLETTHSLALSLIEHCGDELVDSPYVQCAGEILTDEQHFTAINLTMSNVLEAIEQNLPRD